MKEWGKALGSENKNLVEKVRDLKIAEAALLSENSQRESADAKTRSHTKTINKIKESVTENGQEQKGKEENQDHTYARQEGSTQKKGEEPDVIVEEEIWQDVRNEKEKK